MRIYFLEGYSLKLTISAHNWTKEKSNASGFANINSTAEHENGKGKNIAEVEFLARDQILPLATKSVVSGNSKNLP
jgi:hypothetical protein